MRLAMSNNYVPEHWFITALVISAVIALALLLVIACMSRAHHREASKLLRALDMTRDAHTAACQQRDLARREFVRVNSALQRIQKENDERDALLIETRTALLEKLEAMQREYIESYQLDDGESVPYDPTPAERDLINDAISGLLAEPAFVRLFEVWRLTCNEDCGAALIAIERGRQVILEGYTEAHDEQHEAKELILAARAYLYHATGNSTGEALSIWPWEPKGFKPGTVQRDLVKAGALTAAAIDRLRQRVPADTAANSQA